ARRGASSDPTAPHPPGIPASRAGAAAGAWAVGSRCALGRMKQALVDDTEDVSLDFGNEEELAFRKAKI
ncbi:unnamed protein product, partial [Gulo gulo]